MSMPDYSAISVQDNGKIMHAVRWRGKMEPLAVCHDPLDAQRICDALNDVEGAAWNWVPVSERLPDDDIEVLVLTKNEHIHVAVFVDCKWYPRDLGVGIRLTASHITHWIDPVFPNP